MPVFGPGKSRQCLQCKRDYHRTPEAKRRRSEQESSAEGKARIRRYELKRRFGVTEEWFEKKLGEQSGKCAVCNTPDFLDGRKRWPCVDHNHLTGETRGLLCSGCNTGVKLTDSIELLLAKVEYLRKYDRVNT